MTNKDDSRRARVQSELGRLPTIDNAQPGTAGVLLSDQIEACVDRFQLITPFCKERLRPAGYELSIGDEVSMGGRRIVLEDAPGKNMFELKPFEVAVIKIHERLNLPRNIIGRWNIKVGRAYEGLVWVGGPQVDPGWVGNLSCPIYNLSDKAVCLRLHDPIAVIDFVFTTPFSPQNCKPFERPPKRVLFDDYVPEALKSALVTHAKGRIDVFEARLDKLEGRVSNFLVITYTVIGILVAALSVLVTFQAPRAVPMWTYITVAAASVALILAAIALLRSKPPPAPDHNRPRRTMLLVTLAFVLGAAASPLLFRTLHALQHWFDAVRPSPPGP